MARTRTAAKVWTGLRGLPRRVGMLVVLPLRYGLRAVLWVLMLVARPTGAAATAVARPAWAGLRELARRARPWAARTAELAERAAIRLERLESRASVSPWPVVLASPLVVGLWALAMWQAASVSVGADGRDLGATGLVTGLNTLPLLWSRRYPLAAWAPITLASAIMLGSNPLWPLACAVAMLLVLYTVVVRSSRQTGIAATAVSVLAILPMLGNPHFNDSLVLLPLIVLGFVTVFALGSSVRTRRFAERALAEREEDHRRERERRALLEERARIARELHDVVAHHMSMIAVQAETAPYRIDGLPEEGVRDFSAISATAREALTEMRRLLGVLRSESAEVDRAPQPGLDRIGEIVEGARNAGLPVRLEMLGEPRSLPTGIDLSAYRIVQEALSNAGRHARGSNVDVVIRYEADRLEVTVTNDGRGAATAGGRDGQRERAGEGSVGPVAPDGRAGQHVDGSERGDGAAARGGGGVRATQGRGHGLMGMAERVAMLGGSLEAGPRPQGGFQVHATLPLEQAGER